MELLIIMVIAVFIITAAYVGYHASQEPHEEIAEGHETAELNTNSNQQKQTLQVLHIMTTIG